MGAGLLRRRVSGRAEITLLVLYGVVAAYAFGLLMNLSGWPFLSLTMAPAEGLAFVPGDPVIEHLRRFGVYTLLTSTGSFDTGRAITNAVTILLSARPCWRLCAGPLGKCASTLAVSRRG
jgi:energy-coupling factor transport system substrate-specific component